MENRFLSKLWMMTSVLCLFSGELCTAGNAEDRGGWRRRLWMRSTTTPARWPCGFTSTECGGGSLFLQVRAVPGECGEFFMCTRSGWKKRMCPPNKHFNETLTYCVPSVEFPCEPVVCPELTQTTVTQGSASTNLKQTTHASTVDTRTESHQEETSPETSPASVSVPVVTAGTKGITRNDAQVTPATESTVAQIPTKAVSLGHPSTATTPAHDNSKQSDDPNGTPVSGEGTLGDPSYVEKSDVDSALIVGTCIGASLVLIIVAIVFFFLWRRNRRKGHGCCGGGQGRHLHDDNSEIYSDVLEDEELGNPAVRQLCLSNPDAFTPPMINKNPHNDNMLTMKNGQITTLPHNGKVEDKINMYEKLPRKGDTEDALHDYQALLPDENNSNIEPVLQPDHLLSADVAYAVLPKKADRKKKDPDVERRSDGFRPTSVDSGVSRNSETLSIVPPSKYSNSLNSDGSYLEPIASPTPLLRADDRRSDRRSDVMPASAAGRGRSVFTNPEQGESEDYDYPEFDSESENEEPEYFILEKENPTSKSTNDGQPPSASRGNTSARENPSSASSSTVLPPQNPPNKPPRAESIADSNSTVSSIGTFQSDNNQDLLQSIFSALGNEGQTGDGTASATRQDAPRRGGKTDVDVEPYDEREYYELEDPEEWRGST